MRERTLNSDFNRALGDARKQGASLASEVSEAAQAVYDQAVDSASQVADGLTKAAQQTSGSFERALRNTIAKQPYMAVAIAIGVGWLLGRTRRPL